MEDTIDFIMSLIFTRKFVLCKHNGSLAIFSNSGSKFKVWVHCIDNIMRSLFLRGRSYWTWLWISLNLCMIPYSLTLSKFSFLFLSTAVDEEDESKCQHVMWLSCDHMPADLHNCYLFSECLCSYWL